MEGSLNIPCTLSRRQGGLNKIDLDQMARSISLKGRSMPKRELCSALNMVNEPKKATELSKLLDRWQVDYTWNIEHIFYDKKKKLKGKQHVLVKWVGFPRPTYLPVENIREENVEQTVLNDIDLWRDRCGQLGYIENHASLEEDQLPFEDVIMNFDYITKDDIVRVDDRCWSRVSLQGWIRQFIANGRQPTNPATRKLLSARDIVDAGVNPQALMYFNPALYRFENFELAQAEEAKQKRIKDEKRGVVEPPEGRKFISVSVGYDHALGLLDDGTIFGWGSDEAGKSSGAYVAGAEFHNEEYDLFFVAVAAGRDHSLGLLNSGQVVGWGQNSFGQSTSKKFNDDSIYFTQIAASSYYSTGVLNNGTVSTWGHTLSTPLKPKQESPYTYVSAGEKEQIGLLEDGSVVKTNDVTSQLINGKKSKMVAAGNSFTVVLFEDGSVDGGPEGKKFTSISAGKYVLALEQDGTCHAWGNGAPKIDNNKKFKQVSASHGTAKSAGVLLDGTIALF